MEYGPEGGSDFKSLPDSEHRLLTDMTCQNDKHVRVQRTDFQTLDCLHEAFTDANVLFYSVLRYRKTHSSTMACVLLFVYQEEVEIDCVRD